MILNESTSSFLLSPTQPSVIANVQNTRYLEKYQEGVAIQYDRNTSGKPIDNQNLAILSESLGLNLEAKDAEFCDVVEDPVETLVARSQIHF